MNASQLAQYFDHTLLRADAAPAEHEVEAVLA